MIEEILQLKNNLRENNIKGLALDIDETLSWTVGWWVEKMQQLFGNPENLSPIELAKKYTYTQNVPYWQSDDAKEWMKAQIESNEVQVEFSLIENSNDVVNNINKIMPIVAYITTRPTVVKAGTLKWLNKHKFPTAPIIARPSYVDSSVGTSWKADVLNALYPEVLGIIDDNISLVKNLSKEYKGSVFVYGNLVKTENKRVFNCKNWEDVSTKINENINFILN